jgi:MYXO-CTERM domain-containing protein
MFSNYFGGLDFKQEPLSYDSDPGKYYVDHADYDQIDRFYSLFGQTVGSFNGVSEFGDGAFVLHRRDNGEIALSGVQSYETVFYQVGSGYYNGNSRDRDWGVMLVQGMAPSVASDVPVPAGLALLGLAGIAMGRRKR